ncbi:MAG: hypothetical protein GEU80_09175 [Dehalococcoidia bacterium]|nr:hypothetical protein [Dehalococcoidia bacterium]
MTRITQTTLHAAAVDALMQQQPDAIDLVRDFGDDMTERIFESAHTGAVVSAREVALLADVLEQLSYIAGEPEYGQRGCAHVVGTVGVAHIDAAIVTANVYCGHLPGEHQDGACAGCEHDLGGHAAHEYVMGAAQDRHDRGGFLGADNHWHHMDSCAVPSLLGRGRGGAPVDISCAEAEAAGYSRCVRCTGWTGESFYGGFLSRLRPGTSGATQRRETLAVDA